MSTVVSVIGQFLHPPIGLCVLEVANAAHVDRQVYTRARGPVAVDAFGFQVTIFSWPSGYGTESPADATIFDRVVIMADVLHKLADGSTLLTDQIEWNRASLTHMFSESFPESLTVWTAPGTVAVVSWLLIV